MWTEVKLGLNISKKSIWFLEGVKMYNKIKRRAKEGELIEIIETGEIKKVRWRFLGGVHINDLHFTSYLDEEYLVLEGLVNYKEMLIALIKTKEPPLDDVYMVQEPHPFWSKYGFMSYGIGDLWKWGNLDKLDLLELEEIVKKL